MRAEFTGKDSFGNKGVSRKELEGLRTTGHVRRSRSTWKEKWNIFFRSHRGHTREKANHPHIQNERPSQERRKHFLGSLALQNFLSKNLDLKIKIANSPRRQTGEKKHLNTLMIIVAKKVFTHGSQHLFLDTTPGTHKKKKWTHEAQTHQNASCDVVSKKVMKILRSVSWTPGKFGIQLKFEDRSVWQGRPRPGLLVPSKNFVEAFSKK